MNVYEAIRVLLAVSGIDDAYMFHTAERRTTIIAAQSVATEIISRYDALAPTPEMWGQYPWARWYAIDPDGEAAWDCTEPHIDNEPFWETSGDYKSAGMVVLPKHIDWRDCKWSRPEAK